MRFIAFNFLLASALPLSANSVALNISCGYLYGAGGVSAADRLPISTLCVLVADLDNNGFDPIIAGSFVGGGDALIRFTDSEYPESTSPHYGFDLTSGQTGESGFFSRTLTINLDQFAGRTAPVRLALRWFPTLTAATANPLTLALVSGTPYGQFTRMTPLYQNTNSWIIGLSGGAIYALDPLATPEFGGIDSPQTGSASFSVILEPPARDQDADGLPDFVETYFGTPPNVPNSSPLAVVRTSGSVSLRWPEAAPAGVTTTPQWSPDLVTWLASGETANSITARTLTVTTPDAGHKQATLVTAGLSRAFLRLKLTKP